MAEVVEIMDTITVPFKDLDVVVKTLAGAVGSAVLPAILDTGAVAADGGGAQYLVPSQAEVE